MIDVTAQGRLLIVDKELGVRQSLGTWFHQEDYEIAATGNASDALSLLAQKHWDAALVDIDIYCDDGIALHQRIQQADPELIVILMTEPATVKRAIAALQHGAYAYVTKPLDQEEIFHLVKKALSHRHIAQGNALLRQAGNLEACAEISSNGAGKTLHEVERAHILRVVKECGGNQSRSAAVLGIDRVTLYHKLKKYGWSRASLKSTSSKPHSPKPNSPESGESTW